MTPELPTPLSQEQVMSFHDICVGKEHTRGIREFVSADFARNLERCLAVATGALNATIGQCHGAMDGIRLCGGTAILREESFAEMKLRCEQALAQIAEMKEKP